MERKPALTLLRESLHLAEDTEATRKTITACWEAAHALDQCKTPKGVEAEIAEQLRKLSKELLLKEALILQNGEYTEALIIAILETNGGSPESLFQQGEKWEQTQNTLRGRLKNLQAYQEDQQESGFNPDNNSHITKELGTIQREISQLKKETKNTSFLEGELTENRLQTLDALLTFGALKTLCDKISLAARKITSGNPHHKQAAILWWEIAEKQLSHPKNGQ